MRAPTTLGLSGTRGRVPSPGRFPRDRRPCGEGPCWAFFASSASSPVLFTQEVSVSLPNNSSQTPGAPCPPGLADLWSEAGAIQTDAREVARPRQKPPRLLPAR